MINVASVVPHIVVVDDNPADIYLMKIALEESGLQFEMTSFQTGADALLALCPAADVANDPLIPDLILLEGDKHREYGIVERVFRRPLRSKKKAVS